MLFLLWKSSFIRTVASCKKLSRPSLLLSLYFYHYLSGNSWVLERALCTIATGKSMQISEVFVSQPSFWMMLTSTTLPFWELWWPNSSHKSAHTVNASAVPTVRLRTCPPIMSSLTTLTYCLLLNLNSASQCQVGKAAWVLQINIDTVF